MMCVRVGGIVFFGRIGLRERGKVVFAAAPEPCSRRSRGGGAAGLAVWPWCRAGAVLRRVTCEEPVKGVGDFLGGVGGPVGGVSRAVGGAGGGVNTVEGAVGFLDALPGFLARRARAAGGGEGRAREREQKEKPAEKGRHGADKGLCFHWIWTLRLMLTWLVFLAGFVIMLFKIAKAIKRLFFGVLQLNFSHEHPRKKDPPFDFG
jgi:hypothetical protein